MTALPRGRDRECIEVRRELAAMLAAWRADIDSVPTPELVDVEMALALVRESG